MLQEKYAKLDDLAAPNCYVAPPTSEDLSYVRYASGTILTFHLPILMRRIL